MHGFYWGNCFLSVLVELCCITTYINFYTWLIKYTIQILYPACRRIGKKIAFYNTDESSVVRKNWVNYIAPYSQRGSGFSSSRRYGESSLSTLYFLPLPLPLFHHSFFSLPLVPLLHRRPFQFLKSRLDISAELLHVFVLVHSAMSV